MNILLVEDDFKTALYVTEGLQKHGHEVRWAPTGTDGSHNSKIAILILPLWIGCYPTWMAFLWSRRFGLKRRAIQILFLTTMTGLDDRVEGLNAGADDYLTKPFALSELLARLNAIVRRTHLLGNGDMQTHLHQGRLKWDLIARKVTREGQIVDLQHQEFKLLKYFLQNAGRTVTRTMLLENVGREV